MGSDSVVYELIAWPVDASNVVVVPRTRMGLVQYPTRAAAEAQSSKRPDASLRTI
jgi:hypothetical protein